VIGEAHYPLSLGPYGFYWMSIDDHDRTTVDTEAVLEIRGPLEGAFASDGPGPGILSRFVAAQSWYQGRPPRRSQVRVADLIPITPGEQETTMWIAFVSIDRTSSSRDRYVVPVGISFEPDPDIADSAVLARVRRDGTDGVMFDAVQSPQFRAMLLESILAGETLLGRAGSLICTAGIATIDVPTSEPIESTVSTNNLGETYIDFGRGFAIKLFRQVEPGVNPDLELRRFLTERTAFDDIADTYGALEYQSGDTYTLGVLQQSFAEDSTAWNVLSDLARSWLDTTRDEDAPAEPEDAFGPVEQSPAIALPHAHLLDPALDLATRLGRTTAALHQALGSFSEDPDLNPEPFTQHYQQSLYQSLRAGIRQEIRAIRRLRHRAEGPVAAALDELIQAEQSCLGRLGAIRRDRIKGSRIRLHGDYRLDQVHIVDDGFIIADFSGDHSRPLGQRRLRGSPLRDVAQMLRSLDYVALTAARAGSPDERRWAAWWSRVVGLAFAESYLAELEDSPLLPDSMGAIDDLLDAFVLSRALRELHWELVTRPDLVRVPLAGLRRVLGQTPSFVD
jgi:maltose alpha-D-glucosyltransferase/alpha-amylase